MQKTPGYTTREHIETHASSEMDRIIKSLSEWSIMCMSALYRKEADKHHLPVITIRTIIEILPMIGIDPARPWTSLDAIRRQARKEVMSEVGDNVRILESKITKSETDFRLQLANKDAQISALQEKLRVAEARRVELIDSMTKTKRTFF